MMKTLQTSGSTPIKRYIELASEKGASSWLTVHPIEEHGFYLSKDDFRDALCLRYSWPLTDMRLRCECGLDVTIDHAMICKKGGFPILRHNEIRNITADLLKEVCHDVAVEPLLRPLDGEHIDQHTANTSDYARADIPARGVWRRGERAFFDIRVFYPNAKSYRHHSSLTSCYGIHENEKKREYGQRVREVEHGSFTPLVFTSTDGTGPEATTLYKRIASLLTTKMNEHYSTVMQLIRCRISFALLRSAIICIRGTRSCTYHPIDIDTVRLITSETHLTE
ncbi:uncharacterized protein LOC134184773 [Corticium candelabrum]|uniref:uncharacterized protein LOC134184773 n=1 Tax=Corticium candelabrum TaxID=121492 RepID=UPI002E3309E1|nr:uncharacterized protein LOC134184773 [Corticium candelabrum]